MNADYGDLIRALKKVGRILKEKKNIQDFLYMYVSVLFMYLVSF
jgi:hypothetical protein